MQFSKFSNHKKNCVLNQDRDIIEKKAALKNHLLIFLTKKINLKIKQNFYIISRYHPNKKLIPHYRMRLASKFS